MAFFFLYSGDADGELIAKLCGQAAPPVPLVIAAPQVWVHFVSDGSTEDKGFLAHYTFEGKWLARLLPLMAEAHLGSAENPQRGVSSSKPVTIYIHLRLACGISGLFPASLFPFPKLHVAILQGSATLRAAACPWEWEWGCNRQQQPSLPCLKWASRVAEVHSAARTFALILKPFSSHVSENDATLPSLCLSFCHC